MQLPKSDNQKLKILYILDYLQKNSHQDHPVRASELAKMLEGHGILCDRKTIYSDIAALQDFGIDILIYRGKNGGYYIGERQFQLPELKLLIGAVQSSRFLTEEKSLELIDKLCRLCSQEEAEQVRRNVVVAGRSGLAYLAAKDRAAARSSSSEAVSGCSSSLQTTEMTILSP